VESFCCKADSCSMKHDPSMKHDTKNDSSKDGCCCGSGDSCDIKMKDKQKQG